MGQDRVATEAGRVLVPVWRRIDEVAEIVVLVDTGKGAGGAAAPAGGGVAAAFGPGGDEPIVGARASVASAASGVG